MPISRIMASSRRAVTSQTARASFVYLIANTLNAGIPLVLLPVLTRYLTPSDYGNVAMFQALNAIFATITIFGLRVPLLRMLSISASGRANYMTSVLALVGVTTLFTALIAAIFHTYLMKVTNLSMIWVAWAIVSAGAGTVFQLYLTVLQADGRAGRYGAYLNSSSVLNLGLSVFLVALFHLGWIGRAIGIVASSCLAAVFSWVLLKRENLIGFVVREDVSDAFSLASASVVYGISTAFVTYADRFYLSAYYSSHIVGIYTIAAQVSLVLILFGQSLNLALAPWAYRQLSTLKTFSQLRRLGFISLGVSAAVILISGLYYLALMIALKYLVSAEYRDAAVYVPWLLGAACLNALYFVFSHPIFFYKKIGMLSISGLGILLASLGLLYFLQQGYGPIGVAIAMFGSRLLLFGTALCLGIYFAIQRIWECTAEPDAVSSPEDLLAVEGEQLPS